MIGRYVLAAVLLVQAWCMLRVVFCDDPEVTVPERALAAVLAVAVVAAGGMMLR